MKFFRQWNIMVSSIPCNSNYFAPIVSLSIETETNQARTNVRSDKRTDGHNIYHEYICRADFVLNKLSRVCAASILFSVNTFRLWNRYFFLMPRPPILGMAIFYWKLLKKKYIQINFTNKQNLLFIRHGLNYFFAILSIIAEYIKKSLKYLAVLPKYAAGVWPT